MNGDQLGHIGAAIRAGGWRLCSETLPQNHKPNGLIYARETDFALLFPLLASLISSLVK